MIGQRRGPRDCGVGLVGSEVREGAFRAPVGGRLGGSGEVGQGDGGTRGSEAAAGIEGKTAASAGLAAAGADGEGAIGGSNSAAAAEEATVMTEATRADGTAKDGATADTTSAFGAQRCQGSESGGNARSTAPAEELAEEPVAPEELAEEPAAPSTGTPARPVGEPAAADPLSPDAPPIAESDMRATVLNVLRLLPEKQLPFEAYNLETHGPRVHMSETIKDREHRHVLALSLRGKNFTQTKDVELHEDSHLLHLFLAIEHTFGLPMVHISGGVVADANKDRATGVGADVGGDSLSGGANGQIKAEESGESKDANVPTPERYCALPAVLVRRSWAQFVGALPEDSVGRGDILKMDMVGCPSSEWKNEEKFGSLMDPKNWFKKIVDLGIVDNSHSGTIILDDLRPPAARLGYDNVLREKHKPGFVP